jgi:hypothetical protein
VVEELAPAFVCAVVVGLEVGASSAGGCDRLIVYNRLSHNGNLHL